MHVCVGVGHNISLCIAPKTPTVKIFWWQGKHNYFVASFFIEWENTMFEMIRSEENSLKTSGVSVGQFSESLGVKLVFFLVNFEYIQFEVIKVLLDDSSSSFLSLLLPLWLWKKTAAFHPNHASLRLHITSFYRHCPPGAPQKGPFDLGAWTHFLPFENGAAHRNLRCLKGNCTSIQRQPAKHLKNKKKEKRKGNAPHTHWNRSFVHLLAANRRSTEY